MIGRRPVAAFGNSGGDARMLEYTKAGDGARLAMLVLHDGAKREYASVRTGLYAVGVLLILLLEKSFEVRHEKGGVLHALAGILHHEDIPHVVANAIVASCALLVFNVLSLFRKRLGPGALAGMLQAPSGQVR